MKHLVIVGGGFGGVRLARKLAKKNIYKISLVSDQDCFRYYPALYRTATGHAKDESCISLTGLVSDLPNVDVVIKHIDKIDRQTKTIIASDGTTLVYDKVVFGLGVVTSHFGIPGIAENAYGIKSEEEADKLVHHLHSYIEKNKKLDSNYVIVGAGATGVELSASLIPYLKTLAQKFGTDEQAVSVQLIEAAPRILPRMSERAASVALRRLRKLGVEVQIGKKVESQSKKSITIDGQEVSTQTVIWTAGVVNNPFFANNKEQFTMGAHGKVAVNQFMQVDEDTYVIGDNVDMPHSGLALTAVRDAAYVGDSLIAAHYGSEPRPYRQKAPIAVVPVGKNWSLVEYKSVVFGGFIGGILRYCADFIAYYDIMPLGMAITTWRSGNKMQNECPVCSTDISR